MTVREFIEELSSLKEDLKDKDIKVIAENGLRFAPAIKFVNKEEYFYSFDKTSEVIDYLVIRY